LILSHRNRLLLSGTGRGHESQLAWNWNFWTRARTPVVVRLLLVKLVRARVLFSFLNWYVDRVGMNAMTVTRVYVFLV
jgi:hypothetical protein